MSDVPTPDPVDPVEPDDDEPDFTAGDLPDAGSDDPDTTDT